MVQLLSKTDEPIAAGSGINPARAYLPLLTYPDEAVQRQSSFIFIANHGIQAFTLLRRLISSEDDGIRQAAERALLVLGRHNGQVIEFQPFRGMHIECMGRWRVYIGHYEIQAQHWTQRDGGRAGARKVQSMLAYLVHCGHRGATSEEIVAAVWGKPGRGPALARTCSALRQTIVQFGGEQLSEMVLLHQHGRYILAPGEYSSDVRWFEQAINLAEHAEIQSGLAAAIPLYRQACELYGGSYLSGIGVMTDDIDERRAELLSAYLNGLERQAEYAYVGGDDARCLALCHQGRRADPADEGLTLWMLRVYERQQREDEIERVYWRYLRVSGLLQASDPQDRVVQWFRSRVMKI